MKSFHKLSLLVAIAIITFSCSDDESGDTVEIMKPIVTYTGPHLNADFYTPGTTSAPTVEWNGDVGSFSISPEIEGLSINSTTGEISWSNLLPLGTHNFDAVATNAAGQTTISMELENIFSGVFEGYYLDTSLPHPIDLHFSENGTLEVISGGGPAPYEASGTWTKNGNEILANFKFENGAEHSIKGTLSQTASAAEISGNYYTSYGASGTPLGILETTFTE